MIGRDARLVFLVVRWAIARCPSERPRPRQSPAEMWLVRNRLRENVSFLLNLG